MKVALVGYGYWGKILRKYIDASPNFELTAITTKDDVISDPIFTTLDEILENESIEAVFVCTPIDSHYDICKACLQRGKHVFCEKPTVKTMQQFQSILKIAEKQSRIIHTDYIYTTSPSIKKIQQQLEIIGEVCSVSGEISQFGNFYPNDSVDEILGVHLFSVLAYLFPQFTINDIYYNHCNVLKNWEQRVCIIINEKIDVTFLYGLLSNKKIRKIKIVGVLGIFLFDMLDLEGSLRLTRYSQDSMGQWNKREEEIWNFDEGNNLESALKDFQKAIVTGNNIENIEIATRVMEVLDYLRK